MLNRVSVKLGLLQADPIPDSSRQGAILFAITSFQIYYTYNSLKRWDSSGNKTDFRGNMERR